MRVKEHQTEAPMGKKRNKTKQNDYHNTSDEDVLKGKPCSHIEKSVNLSGIKKGLKQVGGSAKLKQCVSCANDKVIPAKKSATSNDDSIDSCEVTTWLCLVCGHQGCGRGTQHQHALKHYEAPRGTSHVLALCLDNMQVWCYKCDEHVYPDDSRKLLECVEWIRKEMGEPKLQTLKKKAKDSDGELTPSKASLAGGNACVNTTNQNWSTRIKGLSNLGNTCFFNAVMQNITQTNVLRELLHEKWIPGKELCVPDDTHLSVKLDDQSSPTNQTQFIFDSQQRKTELEPVTPVTISLPSRGSLTSSLVNFLDEMTRAGKTNIVNPRGLFNQICQKASRFKGYQQQDSHELLRYLLDGLRAEEIKRVQEAVLAKFDIKGSKLKSVDEATKRKIKAYGLHCKHTFVDSIFSGQLLSSVHCNECHVVSEVLEPFLDLSLPIVESKGKRYNVPPRPSDKQSTLHEKKVVDLQPPTAQTAGTKDTADCKQSKHQVQKARDKAKKEARRKHRKFQSSPQDPSNPMAGDATPNESENEDGEDSNDADSETSLFDRPDHKGRVDFTRTVRTTGSTLGLSSKNHSAAGLRPIPTTAARNARPEHGKKHQTPPEEEEGEENEEEVDTDKETDCLVGRIKGLTLVDKEDPAEIALNNLRDVTVDRTPEITDPAASTQSAKTTTTDSDNKQPSCNGNLTSTGDSSGSSSSSSSNRDDDNTTRRVGGDDVTAAATTPPEAAKSSVACGFTQVRLATQEDFSPPVSPASPGRYKVMSTLAPRYQGKSMECSVESCLSQFTVPEWLTGANRFGCENCSRLAGSDMKEKDSIVYTDASKQLFIHQPPSVLTLHLKRFQQVGYSLRKITRHISFPLVLDIAPFCSTSCRPYSDSNQQVLYTLYGLVEHSGRLHFGHYTAYVKARQASDALRHYILGIPANINRLAEQPDNNGPIVNGDGFHDDSTLCGSARSSKTTPTTADGKWYYISDSHVSEVMESKVLGAQAYILFYERKL